jgi:hypothetical protein
MICNIKCVWVGKISIIVLIFQTGYIKMKLLISLYEMEKMHKINTNRYATYPVRIFIYEFKKKIII